MKELKLNQEYERIRKTSGELDYDPPISIFKILNEIKDRNWVIPEFQRDFVWGIDKFTLLFDSIYRGYTIGNILLWKTKEKLAHRKIGERDPVSIQDIKNKEHIYILDGQQRLTTLFAVLCEKELYRSGRKNPKIYKIYFDLKKDEFINQSQKLKEFDEKNIKDLIKENKFDPFRFIDMSQIFNEELRFPRNIIDEERKRIEKEFDKEIISKEEFKEKREELILKQEPLEKFVEIIKAYKIHQIVERNDDLDKVVTVFERINTQNVKLDIYDIMVAKTYENVNYLNKLKTFNLSRAVKKILYKSELKKEELDPDFVLSDDENLYYLIDPTTTLRIISIFLNSPKKIGLQKKDIYEIKAQQIQDGIPKIRNLLENHARYFKNQINIPSIDVTYTDNKILSFLTYVFSKEKYSKCDTEILNKWFWNTVIFNRYPGAQLQRIESDLKEYNKGKEKFLEQIKNDRNLNILNKDYSINNTFLFNAGYNNQKNLYNSLIMLLNSLKPKDFNGKDVINLADYMGANTKNNNHHIIPYNSKAAKSLRKKHGAEKANFMLNNIANISIISTELNQEIKGKDPKDYFTKWEKNKDFKEILKKHLIDKEMLENLKKEEYETFLIKRTKKIIGIIKKICSINNETLEIMNSEENGEG